MEFKRMDVFSRTPEGYRLATLEEVSKNQKNLMRRRILDSSSDARVLDGVACYPTADLIKAGRNFEVFYDKKDVHGWPKSMIVYGKTPTHVSIIPGLLRKELYSQIPLDNEEKILAFSLSFLNKDVEVIHWLRYSATAQLNDFKHKYKLYEDDTDGFSKIVKWLLFENEEIEEKDVSVALSYALRDTARTDLVMEANHAIAIVEIILDICSRKKKMDLVYSQIDRMAESFETKHTAVLAKLLSECAVQTQLKEGWNGIIDFHFEKLFKEAVERGYVPLVKYFLKLHNGEDKPEYLVKLQHLVEDKLMVEADGGKTLLHYAAQWAGGESESSKSSEDDDDVDAVSKLLFRACEDEFVRKLDKCGRSVLHFASFGGRDKFCEFLVDQYHLQNVVDDSRQNFLHYAAQGKNGYRIVDRLHEKLRVSDLVSSINNKGETPLHQAAIYGKTEMIKSLRRRCRPIPTQTLKQTDYGGRTPLHLAAYYGHLKSVEELLNTGSDPLDERDIGGKTALHHVVENTSLPTEDAKALINVLVDHFDNEGQKALLLWASAIGIGTAEETKGLSPDLKLFLKEKKKSFAEVNLLDEAVFRMNSRMTWELLNRGGDIAQLSNVNDLIWVRDQLEKFSIQATDQATIMDTLGRDVLAECIAAHFLNPYIKSPITVGIAGGSGMGKTSLLNMIEVELLVTAADLAFSYSWQKENFHGARNIILSPKGQKNVPQNREGGDQITLTMKLLL